MSSLLHYWCKLCVGSCCLRVAMRWLMRSVSQLTPWHMKDQVVHLDQLSLCRLHPSMFFYWPTLNVHWFDVAVKKEMRMHRSPPSPHLDVNPTNALPLLSCHPQRLSISLSKDIGHPNVCRISRGRPPVSRKLTVCAGAISTMIWGSTMGGKNILWIGQGSMSGGQMAKKLIYFNRTLST